MKKPLVAKNLKLATASALPDWLRSHAEAFPVLHGDENIVFVSNGSLFVSARNSDTFSVIPLSLMGHGEISRQKDTGTHGAMLSLEFPDQIVTLSLAPSDDVAAATTALFAILSHCNRIP